MGFAATLLAGCSTVESIDVSKTDAKDRAGAYLHYSVAKSMFTIQVAAAGGGSSGGGGGAGSASTSTPTSGAAPTSWTLSGTLTAGSGGGGGGGGGSGGGPADASLCAVAAATYAAAQTQVASEITIYAGLKQRLAKMATGVAAGTDTPATLSTDVQNYVKVIRSPQYQGMFVRNPGDPLPISYHDAVDKCPTKVTVSIQQAIVPDTARTFALKARTNILYSDALALSIDANGFLTNGAPTSTSQVGASLAALASDIGEFSLPSTPMPVLNIPAAVEAEAFFGHGKKRHKAPVAPAAPPRPSCVASGALNGLDTQLLDLATCANASSAAYLAGLVLGGLGDPGSLPNLPSAALPLTIYASVEDLIRAADDAQQPPPPQKPAPPPPPGSPPSILDRLAPYSVSLDLNCSPLRTQQFDTGVPDNAVDAEDSDHAKASSYIYDGLVVSTPRACLFQAKQLRSGVTTVVARSPLWTQDSRYLTLLPTPRGFLVARSVAYTFAGGQPTGVTDNRPSEGLALLSFPGTVIGSFFSGLTSAFTNSQVGVTGQTTAVTNQAAKYNAIEADLAAQNAANNAAKGVFPASSK